MQEAKPPSKPAPPDHCEQETHAGEEWFSWLTPCYRFSDRVIERLSELWMASHSLNHKSLNGKRPITRRLSAQATR